MVETQKFANDPRRNQDSTGTLGNTLQIGSALQGRYKITGVVGVGGMGSVYLARDMNFHAVTRNVAVKEMLNLASDPNLREMTIRNFEREANILAELSHPAIPQIYDYFASKDRAYLVMELINGRDLEAVINSMPDFLPFEMVKQWAIELCDVLSYLHLHQPKPIIFRDMKPSNVMIDSQGRVRLIDFGIAKAFQLEDKAKGTQIGTEGYAPPEQYRGEATPSSDLYGLGATLHHVLTRRDPRVEPPFSFAERDITQLNPAVPAPFANVVMRSLSYAADERYSSANAMKEAILAADRALQPGGAATQAFPAAKTKTGPRSGHTTLITPGSKPGESFTEVLEETGTVKPLWKFKVEDEIRATPVAHKTTLFVGAYDNNLYALNLEDGKFKWKFPTEGGIASTPGISTDDNLVVFGSEDNSLYGVDFRTGRISWTFQTGGPIRSPINVQHGHAFFGSDDGKVYAVRLNNGRLAWKYDAGVPVRCKPAVTEERIVVGLESGDVVGLDLAGAMKWRFKTKRAVSSSPVVQDNIAYFGSMDWHVYAVDVINGWAVWRYRTQNAVLSSPALVGRQLFVGSADGHIYALDAQMNGREMWKFKTEGQVISSPVHNNGALYFGGVDQHIYCIEAKKGLLRWKYETGGPITSSACIVDNMVYIGSTDHLLYALNL